jgi:hypothetical protein
MSPQKVVVICRVQNTGILFDRTRTYSDDIAGKCVFIFNNSQTKFLKKHTNHMHGKMHFEGKKNLTRFQSLDLSTCTYKGIMRYANEYMKNTSHRLFIGPAYMKENVVTDFQTVVTGSVEDYEIDNPEACAYRELREEIGLLPKTLTMVDTNFVGTLKVFTLIADF